MGMDLRFHIFHDKIQLENYQAAIDKYNTFHHELCLKYAKELEESYKKWEADPNNGYTLPYSDEESQKLESLKTLIEVYDGMQLEDLYGDSYASYIPKFFRDNYAEDTYEYTSSGVDYLICTKEMLDKLIGKMQQAVDDPEHVMTILPPLDIIKEFHTEGEDDEACRYGVYKIEDGKVKSIYSEDDDSVYIKNIEQHLSAFIKVRKLLDEDSNFILGYNECL